MRQRLELVSELNFDLLATVHRGKKRFVYLMMEKVRFVSSV